jgi:hypothetical protein
MQNAYASCQVKQLMGRDSLAPGEAVHVADVAICGPQVSSVFHLLADDGPLGMSASHAPIQPASRDPVLATLRVRRRIVEESGSCTT